MRIVAGAALATLLAGLPAAPAVARECKDVVTAKARSAAQVSDATRERRARQGAIDNWKKRARDTYGWRFSFWRSADEKNVVCGGGGSAKHCTATAKPCKLI